MADRKSDQREHDRQKLVFWGDTAEKGERKKAKQKSACRTKQNTERALKDCENGNTASAERKLDRNRYQAAMCAEKKARQTYSKGLQGQRYGEKGKGKLGRNGNQRRHEGCLCEA